MEIQARQAEEARNAEIEEHAKKISALRAKFLAAKKLDDAEIEFLAVRAIDDADLCDIAEPYHGNTLLHLAAEAGLFLAATHLLGRGARISARNGNGKLPIELCRDPTLISTLAKWVV